MVHRVVLDVELANAEPRGEAVRSDERREAGVEAGSRLTGDRQQLAIAPEVPRPTADQLPRDERGDGGVVVRHLQRSEALAAHPEGLGRVDGLAQMTAKREMHR